MGDDKLTGGAGADRFAFDGADGEDQILDFTNRADKIENEEGARRFDQLGILKDGEDVVVAFGDTVITIRDVAVRSIGAEDFLF